MSGLRPQAVIGGSSPSEKDIKEACQMLLSFKKNIEGENYKNLLLFLSKQCDAFLLVYINYDQIPEYKTLKQEWQNKLLQDRILIRHNPAWPSTNLVKCPQVPDICIYRLNDHSLRILLSAGSLFDWNYPYLPEDISFFSSGQCIMGINAHERYAFMQDSRENRSLLHEMDVQYNLIQNASPYFEHYER